MSFDRLSPWEANVYFDAPKETAVQLTGGAAKQVAAPNPRRVMLAFGCSAGGNIFISTNPVPSVATSTQLPSSTFGPLVLTHAEWGPFVTAGWYAISGSGITFTVFELFLNEWPRSADELEAMVHANESRALRQGR